MEETSVSSILLMSSPFSKRRRVVRDSLVAEGVDAFVVTQGANRYYLSGFAGEDGVLVVSRSGAALVTDGRFTGQAAEEAPGVRIVLQKGSLFESVGRFLGSKGWKRVGYDPAALTVAEFGRMRRGAGRKKAWRRLVGLTEGFRARKDASEIAEMRKAAVLAGEVLQGVLKLLRPGVREFEIAAEIEYQMRRRGASGPAFPSIVAFGERSALPHARPTGRKLRKNELVVLDLGAILGHYCSDITRTVFVGKAPARVRRWYEAVREAQKEAISVVRAGAKCGEVDAAARRILKRHHLERRFVHSTGHGLGLEVHEEPRVAQDQKQRLLPGNVITIEPGVYVPGAGGIRIEDDVVVHENSAEVLTRVSREFIEL